MGLLDKIGDVAKRVAPFGGRMLGLDKKDKEKFRPEQQYAGGSKEASDAMRDRYEQGTDVSDRRLLRGLERSKGAADQASESYGRLEADAYRERQSSRGRADAQYWRSQQGADAAQQVADQQMAQDRRRIVGVADDAMAVDRRRMIGLANNAEQDYQRTADAQFRATQDANQRAALAAGSRGGASGLRTALAGSTLANQQAATQAQIVNAQEQNELNNYRAGLLSQAAGINADRVSAYGQANAVSQGRAGVYGNLANLGAQREQAARADAIQQQGIQGNAIGSALAGQQNAAGQQIGASVATRGQSLGAETGQTAAELNAAREYEGQRQQNEKQNYTQNWFPLKRFNAPA